MAATNLEAYNQPGVAAHYCSLNYITPCERHLFDLYIKSGAVILDLGVGGGRTTPYLSSRGGRYIGVDNASEMIGACRQKYPALEFLLAEAWDLSGFRSGSCDVVVCAFNGLDYVLPDSARARCFEECYRVLRPGGILLFSSHNPRAIFIRPSWNRERVRRFAEKLCRRRHRVTDAVFILFSIGVGIVASCRAVWRSIGRIATRVPTRAFRRGEGYIFDSVHGGLMTHCWVPHRVVAELEQHRFCPLRVLGDDYPHVSQEHSTDWYYYVFSKSDSVGDGETCS